MASTRISEPVVGNGLLRTFIGVSPSPTCSVALLDAQKRYARQYPNVDVHWIKEENLHLTLIFLGDQSPADLERLVTALSQRPQLAAFSLEVEHLGPFPHGPSRILAARVQLSPELTQLHQQVSTLVDDIGIQRDRKAFTPHITLARSRSRIHFPKQHFRHTSHTTGLILYLSERRHGGVHYRPLAEFRFA